MGLTSRVLSVMASGILRALEAPISRWSQLAVAACLTATVALPGAQAPATPGAPAPIALDFLALGPDGLPVPDLTADQLQLRVDGRARTVQTLRYVTVDDRRAGPAAPRPDPPYATNVVTDLVPAGRALVIAVEDESLDIGRERLLREAVAMLLTSLTPRDRVAVVTLPHGGLKVDFTTDHALAIKAIEAITGQAPRTESDTDAACRTRDTLHGLTGLLHDLAGGEGPTTVLFFSMGMVGPSQMVLPAAGAPGQATPVIGRCTLLPESFTKAGAAAEAARANFYVVRPDTAAPGPGRLEGLENLAGVTGATRLSLGAASEIALSRVARETAGYYMATFTPGADEQDGLGHRLDLRTTRTGVQIRARSTVAIAKPGLAAPVSRHARDLLREGRVLRELPLRVAAYASRGVGDRLRIVTLAEPLEPAVTLTSAAVGLLNSKGQLVAQWSSTDADLTSRLIQAGLLAPRGFYRVRAVAVDTAGRRGTADYELDAALTPAGPLLLSSLVVGLSRDGRFVPRLEFGTEASAMAQLEIYGGAAGTAVGALLELSDGASGKPLLAVPLILEATADPDRFTASGIIPLGALPPGDYVARAIVEQKGQPAGRTARTIRKR